MLSGRPDTSEIVDAMVLAARHAKLSQRFPVAELPRWADSVVKPQAEADLQAHFHWLDGRCGIKGQVTATLRATCQRCLQPIDLDVADEFHVVLVKTEEEMSQLPDAQDSMIADAAHLDLAWLTEEQLLLAMPLVPLHEDGHCGASAAQLSEIGEASAAAETQTPFAQLRELMKKQ